MGFTKDHAHSCLTSGENNTLVTPGQSKSLKRSRFRLIKGTRSRAPYGGEPIRLGSRRDSERGRLPKLGKGLYPVVANFGDGQQALSTARGNRVGLDEACS